MDRRGLGADRRIGEHPINRVDELLPWAWAARSSRCQAGGMMIARLKITLDHVEPADYRASRDGAKAKILFQLSA